MMALPVELAEGPFSFWWNNHGKGPGYGPFFMSAAPVAFNSNRKKFLKFSSFIQKKIPLKEEIYKHPKGKSNKSVRPKGRNP